MRQAQQSDRPVHAAGGRSGPTDIITPRPGAILSGTGWHGRLGLHRMHEDASGEGVVVGIVGTGIDAHHPAYRTRVVRARAFGAAAGAGTDIHGHGTHLAGVIAAGRTAPTGRGTAPDATIASACVVNVDGRGRGRHVAAGITWLASLDARVILVAVDAAGPDPVVESAIADVCRAGILVVRPPRSRRTGQPHPPGDATSSQVVVVGMADYGGRVGPRSMGWTDVDVVYPGMAIRSSYPGGRTAMWTHPVVSAAGVAGLLACIISHAERSGTTVQTDMVRRILVGSCRVYAHEGDRGECGHGVPIPADILCADPPVDLDRPIPWPDAQAASERSGRGRPGGAPARPYDPYRRYDRPSR